MWLDESSPTKYALESDFVLLPNYSNKELRKYVHQWIGQEYPNLMTTTVTKSSSTCVDDFSELQKMREIKISRDLTFLPLLESKLPLGDIKALYRFKNSGPSDSAARNGILIGANLDKKDRTNIYRSITCCCPGLDSKTVNRKNVSIPLNNSDKRNKCFVRVCTSFSTPPL